MYILAIAFLLIGVKAGFITAPVVFFFALHITPVMDLSRNCTGIHNAIAMFFAKNGICF